MTSLLWYTGLCITGFVITACTIYIKRHDYRVSTLVVFCLFAACITWIGEFIVLGLFDSYAYKTGISSDPWAQNLAGHLFLNASMFPAAAVLIATNPLGFWGISLIVAVFILAEYLFEVLGIYEQHWWKYYMSVINTLLFLAIVKKWFAKIKHAHYDIPRLLTFYFVAMLIIHTPAPFLLLWGKQYYTMDVLEDMLGNMYRCSIMVSFNYHLIESALLVFFVCILKKWYWKLAPYIIVVVGQSTLAKMKMLNFMEGWRLLYTIIIYFISLTVFILIEKHTLKPHR